MSKRQTRKKIVDFVERNEIRWYIFALVFTVLSVPAAFIALPSIEMATFVVASITGIMASLAALATALISSNQDQKEPEEEA